MSLRLTRILLIALGLAAAAAAFLAIGALRDDPAPTSDGSIGMKEMTPRQLDAFSRKLGHTIFWAGAEAGTRVSAGRNAQGTVIVSYDAADGSVLDGVMVATYPMRDAAGNLRRQAERDKRFELATSRDGRLVLIDKQRADHAYLAEPGSDRQIEVHSPVGDHALRLVTEGRIVACCGA